MYPMAPILSKGGIAMSPVAITLALLLFVIVMFVWEKKIFFFLNLRLQIFWTKFVSGTRLLLLGFQNYLDIILTPPF